jgi:hypothetical protein
MNDDKAQLRALKEGIDLAAPGVTDQLILRVTVVGAEGIDRSKLHGLINEIKVKTADSWL